VSPRKAALVVGQLEDSVDRRYVLGLDLRRDAARRAQLVEVAKQAEARDVGHRVRARCHGVTRRASVQLGHHLDSAGDQLGEASP
jgi:cyanophycinase-like exopeptidase